jgi:hypothetical protein
VAPWASTGSEGRWRSAARVSRVWCMHFGGMRTSRGAETVVPTVRSCHHGAGVRRRPRGSNGRERERDCASGVVGYCGAQMHERKGLGEGVG